jgi:hypothetical protein
MPNTNIPAYAALLSRTVRHSPPCGLVNWRPPAKLLRIIVEDAKVVVLADAADIPQDEGIGLDSFCLQAGCRPQQAARILCLLHDLGEPSR